MSFFSPKIKKEPYGTLNPEQIYVAKGLGSAFQSRLNNGPSYYGGTLNADISPEELNSIQDYGRLNTLRNNSLSSIFSSSPEALNSEFDSQVANPTLDFYKRNIQPLTEENLSAFSTDRGRIVGGQLTDLAGSLSQQRFDAQQKRREQILGASGALNAAGATTQAINAVPREITQAGLDRQYTDYLNANKQHADSINQMLTFLGINTGTVQSKPSTLSQILGYGQDLANIFAAVQGNPYAGTSGLNKITSTGGNSNFGTDDELSGAFKDFAMTGGM